MSSMKNILMVCSMALTMVGVTPAMAASSQSIRPAGVIPQASLVIVGTNLVSAPGVVSSSTPQPVQPLVSIPGTFPTAEPQNRGLGIGQQGTGTIGQQGSTLTTPPLLTTPTPAISPQTVQPSITPQQITPVMPPQTITPVTPVTPLAPVTPLQGRGLGIGPQGSGTSIGPQGTTVIGPQGNGAVTGQQGITPVPALPPPPAAGSDQQGNSLSPNNNASSPNGAAAATGLIVPNTTATISRQPTFGSFNPPQGAIIFVGPQTTGSGTVSAQRSGTTVQSQMRLNSNVGRAAGSSGGAAGK